MGSGDELFSDTYPMKLVDNCMYEVYGKHVTRKVGDDIVLEGSNASAEEGDEGTEEATESGFCGLFGSFITFLSTGVRTLQNYVIPNLPGYVLAVNLVHAVVDQLHGVGVREQLVTGENILVDLHGGVLVDYFPELGDTTTCLQQGSGSH